MSSKQALIQEIDTLPPESIDDVFQFVSFLKYKAQTPSDPDESLNELDNLLNLIRTAADEPMPQIEPIRLREVEA